MSTERILYMDVRQQEFIGKEEVCKGEENGETGGERKKMVNWQHISELILGFGLESSKRVKLRNTSNK
jgi:hypothetical protein